jgi:hypothetical protein
MGQDCQRSIPIGKTAGVKSMEKNLQTWQIAHVALQRCAVNFLLKDGKHPFERIELRPPACDQMAEVIGPATVATLAHHFVQPTGGERGKLLQGLQDEGPTKVELRKVLTGFGHAQAGLLRIPLIVNTVSRPS